MRDHMPRDMPVGLTIDLVVLQELRAEVGPAVVGELIALYLVETPTIIAAMRQRQAAGDEVGLRRLAHKLQGSSGVLGAERLRHLCAALDGGRAVDGRSVGSGGLAAIEAEFGRVAQALRGLVARGSDAVDTEERRAAA